MAGTIKNEAKFFEAAHMPKSDLISYKYVNCILQFWKKDHVAFDRKMIEVFFPMEFHFLSLPKKTDKKLIEFLSGLLSTPKCFFF